MTCEDRAMVSGDRQRQDNVDGPVDEVRARRVLRLDECLPL